MKKIISWKIRALCILMLGFLSVASMAETSLWTISRGNNQVLIGGTIHMLKPSDYPLPKEYAAAFSAAKVVIFETDLDAVQDPAFAMKMMQEMTLTNGQTLQSTLSPKTWGKLQAYATKTGFPIAAMQAFKPAFVGIMLSMLEMQKLGFSEGIDVYFYNQAKAANKQLGALETPDEQLQFMLSMTKVDPNAFIASTLRDLDDLPTIMEQTVAAWRSGDVAVLDKLLGKPMRDEVPELYSVMLTQRNKAWVTEIEALLKTSETELILVGAMHLAGPDSVLNMLRAKGIKISRY